MVQLTLEQIKSKILEDNWTRWLERKSFKAFIISFSEKAITKEYMNKIGADIELESCLSENGNWYFPEKAMKKCANQLLNWLNSGHELSEITNNCEELYKQNKKYIRELIKSNKPNKEKLNELFEIFSIIFTFIWITHPLEEAFKEELKKKALKYVKDEEVEKFIGDISIPIKKNAHTLFEETLSTDKDAKEIIEEYGWIKTRNMSLLSPDFTKGEIEELRKNPNKETKKEQRAPKIPRELADLTNQMRELVWFRTFRTDVFYELLYIAKPIIIEIAKEYKIPENEIQYYRVPDLISGKLKRYPEYVTFANYRGNFAYFDKPILEEEIIKDETIKGVIAYKGKMRGRVKIVNSVDDVPKVQEGDILVATMTFPSYIMAMKKASAFVTNEGGITCHASIVAREMKKPCIVGTKIATKVLKNGMLIEVDADKGVVKILK
jgi:phosphoenolpyruvate synthase/pyruvate phosphate dikinase